MWCNSNNTEAIQIYINTIFHIYNSMKGRSKFISKVIILTFNFTLEYKKEINRETEVQDPKWIQCPVLTIEISGHDSPSSKNGAWSMDHLHQIHVGQFFFRNAYSWGPLQTYLLIFSSKSELWSLTFQKCHGRFLTYSNFLKILKDHQWLNKDNIYWATTRCKLFAVLYKKSQKSITFFLPSRSFTRLVYHWLPCSQILDLGWQ